MQKIMKGMGLAAVLSTAACGGGRTEQQSAGQIGTDSLAATGDSASGAGPAKADRQMQAVLDQLAALGGKPLTTLTAGEARKQPTPTDAVKALLEKQGKGTAPEPGVRTADRMIPGAAGPIPARIYTPESGTAPFPVVVYYHGGGWVIANKDVYDGGARSLSKMAGAVVVSIDYRQGPEHKFPAAHDDAFAAYRWVLKNAAAIKGDPRKVAVAGESAGGGLAIATAMAARDKRLALPLAIVSVYPIAGTDTTTPSYTENADAKPLNRPMMGWFFKNYLRGPADYADPRVDLVHADIKGLPPTTIINAQIDPLRSEGEMLAERLKAAGIPVDQKTYDGVAHEFFGMGAVVDKAKDAEQMAADALKKAFAS